MDIRYVERVEFILSNFENYFKNIHPIPFLDDLTTKNVIIANGSVSGIVDTDQVCFGDSMFTISLTNQAILSRGADTDYIEYLLSAMNADSEKRIIMKVYSILFCLIFMSELGQVFNKKIEFNKEIYGNYRAIFEKLEKEINTKSI